MGVFPHLDSLSYRAFRLPHARGGVSMMKALRVLRLLSSPRPWGCFRRLTLFCLVFFVFPTPVGVFPSVTAVVPSACSLPHARGGVSR
ncbi:hypothetical protein BMETH_996_3 [methanotrophic bacterial endosymbiont of Bathymodiolus sp.]|nr:hypothetical protein BMETH_996_3 [methanotrophic bacterial endosymbiont of Bathymodiolus sp.]